MIPRSKNKRFSKIQATKKGIWDMIQPINPVTLVLFVVWHCPQWNSGGFFRLWLWSYLDSGSKFYVAASSRSPGKIHFKLWNIFFLHRFAPFLSSFRIISAGRVASQRNWSLCNAWRTPATCAGPQDVPTLVVSGCFSCALAQHNRLPRCLSLLCWKVMARSLNVFFLYHVRIMIYN